MIQQARTKHFELFVGSLSQFQEARVQLFEVVSKALNLLFPKPLPAPESLLHCDEYFDYSTSLLGMLEMLLETNDSLAYPSVPALSAIPGIVATLRMFPTEQGVVLPALRLLALFCQVSIHPCPRARARHVVVIFTAALRGPPPLE
jgi:hypothetical protein